MDFTAKRRKLRVNIDGEVHEMRFPVLSELREYQERLSLQTILEQEKTIEDFLASLGLPVDAQGRLELSDLREIMGLISDQKKTP